MIRGCIESVANLTVSGWIYADAASLRDRTVLAFVDERCVGVGRVEHFRQDLADAGLADGVLGFHIPIMLPDPADAGRVTVRLEESDAALLQPGSRILPASGMLPASGTTAAAAPGGRASRPLSSLQWMRTQGWLDQSQYDFLKYQGQLGAYERTLRQRKCPDEPERANLDPAEVVKAMFCLYYQDDIALQRTEVASLADLAHFAGPGAGINGWKPIVALWCVARIAVAIVGRAQRPGGQVSAPAEYYVAPDQVLLVDPGCTVTGKGAGPAGGITVFSAAGKG